MLRYLRQLVDERNALTGLMQTTTERAADETRELTDTEQSTMREWQTRCAELDRQIGEHNEQAESQRAWATLQERLAATDEPVAASTRSPGYTRPRAVQGQHEGAEAVSWGEALITSDAFASYSGRGSSGVVEVPYETRAAIATGDVPAVPYQWVGPPTPNAPTPLLQLIGNERVSTGSVEYLYWPPPDPVAVVVAEGSLKPEATILPTPGNAVLQTYAHYKAITRQALEDIPRIQSIVEGKLRRGLDLALEAATVAALTANTDIPDVAADATTGLLGGLRMGAATVEDADFTPTVALLNPADWASIDLALLAGTLNGPVTNNSAFGLRLVASSAIPAGTAYVGAFGDGITLFDRGQANVFLTDSHADFFLRNTLVVLAETRAVVVVTEPIALAKVVLPPAGP
jgi:HK97 family phage major capsid protein